MATVAPVGNWVDGSEKKEEGSAKSSLGKGEEHASERVVSLADASQKWGSKKTELGQWKKAHDQQAKTSEVLSHLADQGKASLKDQVKRMKEMKDESAPRLSHFVADQKDTLRDQVAKLKSEGTKHSFIESRSEAGLGEGDHFATHHEVMDQVHGRAWTKLSTFCMHPEGAVYIGWNVALALSLAYISVTVPLQMGFRFEAEPWSTWKAFDVFFDSFFIIDFFLNFFHGFLDHEGHLVMRQPACAKNYMRSPWIWIDGFTSVPYDWFGGYQRGSAGGNVAASDLRMLKSFKAAKILRLNRLVRGSLIDLVEDFLSTSGTFRFCLKLIKLTFGMLFVLHVMSCTWHFVADPRAPDNWVRGYLGSDEQFLRRHKIEAEFEDSEDWDTDTWPLWPRYLAAMYWSTMTLSTVGYGDVLPQCNLERVMAIVGMVFGGGVYGIVLGNLVSIVTDVDMNTRAYQERMGAIISYMNQRGFPPLLVRKIKRFYRRYFKSKSALDEKTILAELPAKLKTESSMFLVSELVFGVDIFNDLEQSHLPILTELIAPVFFEQSEMVLMCGDDICDINIVSSGMATIFDSKGEYIDEAERGASFGHEALCSLDDGPAQWDYSLVAAEFSEVLTIPVHALIASFEGEPIFAKMKERAKLVPKLVKNDGRKSSEELSEADRKRLKEAFEAADDDGSGEIDLVEFVKLIKLIMGEEKEKAPSEKDLVGVFNDADTDGGGTVDWEEFCGLYLRVKNGLVKGLPKHVLAKATKEKILQSGQKPLQQHHKQNLEEHHTRLTNYIDRAMAEMEAKIDARPGDLERALMSKLGPAAAQQGS